MVHIVVLGAAAGGGFPQWNCNCGNCRRARSGDPAAKPQTQSSLAVSADGESWFLLNASPDLGTQILRTAVLHPREGKRHSPIKGAVLTNADVDHVTGLLTLRESQTLAIHGTPRVLSVLQANAIFNVLNPDFVKRRPMVMDQEIELCDADGNASGLLVEPFTVPGKVALWLEDPTQAGFGSMPEDTIALKLRAKGSDKAMFYIPGCAAMPDALAERLRGASMVFFDGTTFTDHEMIAAGIGVKSASRMGHMAMSGDAGTLKAFEPLGVERKIFIHINNSNPVLLSDSPERAAVEAAGWVVAQDGMEFQV